MIFTVVGSGTAVPEPDRVCSGYLIETAGVTLLLDCGPGVVHHLARFGLPWSQITHVALTHFHNDHIGDLPMLLFALQHGMLPGRQAPLTVIGPPGLRERIERLADALGDHVRAPRFPLELSEPGPGEVFRLADGATLRAQPTRHTMQSVAYRVTTDAATVGYTGDTGYDEETAAFLAGVDLLALECSLPEEYAMDAHLTPSTAARMANLAQPATLLLTHVYPLLDRTRLADLVRQAGWTGETRVARDGMSLPFPRRTGRPPASS
jgi:ribonuclease BN (tRNA processing enzyme)